MADVTMNTNIPAQTKVTATATPTPSSAVAATAATAAVAKTSEVSAVKETSAISPKAQAGIEFDKSNAAWEKGVAAFNKLPEADKTELSGRMNAAYAKQLELNPSFTEDQKAETLWAVQANEAANWAGEKAAQNVKTGYTEGGAAAARNLGDLYYGANDYLTNRNAYLGDHNGVHGAVGSVDFTLVDNQGKLVQSDAAPTATSTPQGPREPQLSDFFPAGSEAAKDTNSARRFGKALEAFKKLPKEEQADLAQRIEQRFQEWGGQSQLSPSQANDVRANVASSWAIDKDRAMYPAGHGPNSGNERSSVYTDLNSASVYYLESRFDYNFAHKQAA